jgi:hypothetical protein
MRSQDTLPNPSNSSSHLQKPAEGISCQELLKLTICEWPGKRLGKVNVFRASRKPQQIPQSCNCYEHAFAAVCLYASIETERILWKWIRTTSHWLPTYPAIFHRPVIKQTNKMALSTSDVQTALLHECKVSKTHKVIDEIFCFIVMFGIIELTYEALSNSRIG